MSGNIYIRLLMTGMMVLHSFLGCHLHHLSAACCPLIFDQKESVEEAEAVVAHTGCSGCAAKISTTASTETDRSTEQFRLEVADTPPASHPHEACCEQTSCVFLHDASRLLTLELLFLPELLSTNLLRVWLALEPCLLQKSGMIRPLPVADSLLACALLQSWQI